MSTEKVTAAYVRVSTTGQDFASQLPDLERWVANHDGPVEWFRDKYTGKTLDRPGMNKLLDALHAGRVERIVCWRLDRLGRTARGLCELFEELHERRVDLVSIRDGFTLNTPAGRLHARILASVAQFETEIRAERVRAGQAAARAKGRKWGGSKPGRLLKVTPDQLQTVLDMVGRGVKISRVARSVGLSRKTVYRLLDLHGPKPEPTPVAAVG